jgi:hypothetical protein
MERVKTYKTKAADGHKSNQKQDENPAHVHLDSRKMKMRVCADISNRDFHQYYELCKKNYCRGDFFEIRQIRSK